MMTYLNSSVVIMTLYDRVNEEKMALFTHKGNEIQNIPSTQYALAQHELRVGNEVGHVWDYAMITISQLPSPENVG